MIVFSILLFRHEILGIQHQIGIINKQKNQYTRKISKSWVAKLCKSLVYKYKVINDAV